MKEYTVVFQVGNVSYLQGNCFYIATIQEFPSNDDSTRYWVQLHDEVLVSKFGQHHDYYHKEDNKVEYTVGDNEFIMDLHIPIKAAIEKIRSI